MLRVPLDVIGTFLAVVVVFAILVVASRSLAYFRRGRLSVADSDVTTGTEVRRSAVAGGSAGLLVLLLMALLYLGISRWDWLGHPAVSHSAVASPMPVASPASGAGAGLGASPAAALPSASPSP